MKERDIVGEGVTTYCDPLLYFQGVKTPQSQVYNNNNNNNNNVTITSKAP